jgi:hypothetical protein
MTTIFAFDPGKSEMKVSTIQIFVNHSHDISAPIAVPGFIHIIPYLLQLLKMVFNALIISACFGIARLIP